MSRDHISICICTFKRPALLVRTLDGISRQVTDNLFTYEAVVVDNDAAASAREMLRDYREKAGFPILYDWEPERSISLARNRTIRNATGNLIAFIDDDEFPDDNWLMHHYALFVKSNPDGILGPVLPHFDVKPPRWLEQGKLCERERFKSGTRILQATYTRTGNAFLAKKLFDGEGEPFDPQYGISGGGDAVFFGRMIERGRVFLWCDEALVFETVPPERQKRMYYIRRAFTRGMTSAWSVPFFSKGTLKSIFAVGIYSLSLPVFFILGHHLFMKVLIKDCDHISKLLAYAGINLVKKRPY